MRKPRTYTRAGAEALLAGTTSGPWRPFRNRRDDEWVIAREEIPCGWSGVVVMANMSQPDAALAAAAPDLVRSVAHHATRADDAEAEVKRLRDLVRGAYREGWSTGESGAGFGDAETNWLQSTARAEVARPTTPEPAEVPNAHDGK